MLQGAGVGFRVSESFFLTPEKQAPPYSVFLPLFFQEKILTTEHPESTEKIRMPAQALVSHSSLFSVRSVVIKYFAPIIQDQNGPDS
jgi:hypothetical protein